MLNIWNGLTQEQRVQVVIAVIAGVAACLAQFGMMRGKLVIWGWDALGWLTDDSPGHRKGIASMVVATVGAIIVCASTHDWSSLVPEVIAIWVIGQGTLGLGKVVGGLTGTSPPAPSP